MDNSTEERIVGFGKEKPWPNVEELDQVSATGRGAKVDNGAVERRVASDGARKGGRWSSYEGEGECREEEENKVEVR